MRFSWLAALALVACSAAPGPDETLGSSTEAVVGGIASTADQDAVVLVIGHDAVGHETYSCSGTVVASNLVLTARHCVSTLANDNGFACGADGTLLAGPMFGPDIPAAQLGIFTGVGARMSEYDRAASSANGRQVLHAGGSVICNADLAFIVLDRPLTVPVAPMRTTAPAAGEALTLIGYGLVGNSGLSFIRQQRAQTIVDVGPKVLDTTSMDGLSASELLVGEGICNGDSGGPTLSAKGEVVGVVSRGGGGMQNVNEIASDCLGASVTNVLTDLTAASALIEEAKAAAAAALPTSVTPPAPTSTGVPSTPPPTAAGTPARGPDSGGCAVSPTHKTPRGDVGTSALVAAAGVLSIRRCARRGRPRPSRRRCT